MGLYYSTPATTAVPIVEEKTHDIDPNLISGVRVTGDAAFTDIEEKISQSYEKRKAESPESFQGALKAVAAQVYDNVHEQLAKIEK